MTERWELDSTSARGTFLITPYKPIYILPIIAFKTGMKNNPIPTSRKRIAFTIWFMIESHTNHSGFKSQNTEFNRKV